MKLFSDVSHNLIKAVQVKLLQHKKQQGALNKYN